MKNLGSQVVFSEIIPTNRGMKERISVIDDKVEEMLCQVCRAQ